MAAAVPLQADLLGGFDALAWLPSKLEVGRTATPVHSVSTVAAPVLNLLD